MKIRSGFVSNSSSSSFIVRVRRDPMGDTMFEKHLQPSLTKKQLKVLRDMKFKYSLVGCPAQFHFGSDMSFDKSSYVSEVRCGDAPSNHRFKYDHMGLSVMCNQDYVILRLVKHKIPFHAVLHDCTESLFYGGSGDVMTVPNRGIKLANWTNPDMDMVNQCAQAKVYPKEAYE